MWTVNASTDKIIYTEDQLVTLLTGKIVSQPVPVDQALLVDNLWKHYQVLSKGELSAAVLESMFRFGYYYRLFLEKNNVVRPQVQAGDTSVNESSN